MDSRFRGDDVFSRTTGGEFGQLVANEVRRFDKLSANGFLHKLRSNVIKWLATYTRV